MPTGHHPNDADTCGGLVAGHAPGQPGPPIIRAGSGGVLVAALAALDVQALVSLVSVYSGRAG